MILAHNRPVDSTMRRRQHTVAYIEVAPRSEIIDNRFETAPKIPNKQPQMTAFMDLIRFNKIDTQAEMAVDKEAVDYRESTHIVL